MKTEIKKLPKSEVQVDFELDENEFAESYNRALEHFRNHVKMDGFRKGMVPKEMIEKQVKAEDLLMEAGDLAVKKAYGQFVKETELEPIGDPEVKVLKIAKGNPFLFQVTVAVLPEISLPDYKKIAGDIKGIEVSVNNQEVEDALRYLQKSRAKFSQVERGAEKQDYIEIAYQNEHINNGQEVKDRFILGEGGFLKDFEDNVIGMKQGEEKEFSSKFPDNTPDKKLAGKESQFKIKMVSVQKMDLPELNDEFAKSLGVFENLDALKQNIKGGITMEKQEGERQRRRNEMLSKIASEIKFELPEKMVKYEEERLFDDFKQQIAQNTDMSVEKYLESIKKTEEDIKKSISQEAERRIKNFLVLRQIGKAENVQVQPEEIEADAQKLVKNYSKEQLAKIDIEQVKEYSKGALLNEKVFQVLENFSSNENS